MEKRYVGNIENVINEINEIKGSDCRFIGSEQAINEMAWETLIKLNED
jgi:hypothetical protein